ncbi:hypothetical protein Ctob_012820 [Chrysochromulina tobinii]|uniref:Uncharacterized protein n=1 Tax=Chrysochromulina tobinii TaxID=1460289 RepID=A0A0M0LQZ7_9EUKA|nr:hypothetical protein Ctob_012820 [Chrysochromulina tobinii]|eukprot:KOO53465.1 hypothetical protein Ctob_012820 [Chrysochromulina sp. CCMP291]
MSSSPSAAAIALTSSAVRDCSICACLLFTSAASAAARSAPRYLAKCKAASSGVAKLPRQIALPSSRICTRYLSLSLRTPLKPVSLPDDVISSSPSAAAAAQASSAVSGCGPSPLASAASAAARSAPTCLAYHKAASSGVAKAPR